MGGAIYMHPDQIKTLIETLKKGPPNMADHNYLKTVSPEEYAKAEAKIAKTRWQIEAEIDDAATARMNAMLDRIADKHKANAATGKEASIGEDDEAWANSRAETLKYKLAQKQQEAELEKLFLLKQEAAQIKAEQEAAQFAQYYATTSTTSVGGPVSYFGPTPPATLPPEPPKPAPEIPILRFGKRRINLKDVA
jgi:hypothetical protein